MAKCKFCKQQCDDWEEIQNHVFLEHPDEYQQIQLWLQGIDDKLESYQRLADEGMHGHKEPGQGKRVKEPLPIVKVGDHPSELDIVGKDEEED